MSYLDKLDAMLDAGVELGEEIGMQKCADYFFVALAVRGFGQDRLKDIFDLVHEVQRDYSGAYRCDAESDFLQERMDSILRKACGEYFVPFAERNPHIRQYNYRKHLSRRNIKR